MRSDRLWGIPRRERIKGVGFKKGLFTEEGRVSLRGGGGVALAGHPLE